MTDHPLQELREELARRHTPPGASSSAAAPPTAEALVRQALRQLADLEALLRQLAELQR